MTPQEKFKAAAARRRFGPETTAYRLVNGKGDGLEELCVDWFDGVAVLSLYRELPPEEEEALCEALHSAVKPQAIYLKRRPREARQSVTRTSELAPETPIRGEAVAELEVREAGLKFLIRPPNGLSVGLYLDSRDARSWVKAHAAQKRVLNCFSYTCGFGLAALAGGAKRAVNVDLSRRVLEWGRQNAELNGLADSPGDYLSGDAFEWLSRLAKRKEQFELVVVDPPSFSTTKRGRFSAATDYAELATAAGQTVAPGGTLLAMCNLAGLTAERFSAMVKEGLDATGRTFRLETQFGASPEDFPPPSALKAAVFSEAIRSKGR